MKTEQLHFLLTKHIISTGHVPSMEWVASQSGTTFESVKRSLRELEAMHGVILEPNSLRVWRLHPFALMPTRFWVSTPDGGWWANCAWCALGIGAALNADVVIETGEGAEGTPLVFSISGKVCSNPSVLMHFPDPPFHWWDNPYCPCGNILFFTSQDSIENWCRQHGRPRGATLDIATGVALAERWFGDYASRDWVRKTPEQAVEIFEELELDPGFWRLDDTSL